MGCRDGPRPPVPFPDHLGAGVARARDQGHSEACLSLHSRTHNHLGAELCPRLRRHLATGKFDTQEREQSRSKLEILKIGKLKSKPEIGKLNGK